jgi:hypothetical protein
MAQWKIEPSWKKSIIERQYFTKDGNTISVETGWRWGSFETETDDENIPNITSGDDLWSCDYEVELIETWDGCWEEVDSDDCDEETQEWLEEFLEENSWLDLEEHGWIQTEAEMIIDCDPIFERLDGPNAGKRYDVDGDEIPSDDEETTETIVEETPKLQPQAKWPFENATIEEDTEPEVKWPIDRPYEGPRENAQFTCEDCGYTTEDIMDLDDNPNDDDKGALLCPECGGKVDLG